MALSTEYDTSFEPRVHRLAGHLWLVPGLVAGLLVHVVYLFTHPYPAFGAGLFLLIAEQISQHGYQLPATIPHYAKPIPFAYPPLMFYVVALLRDVTGIGGIALTRYLPGLVSVAALVPFYLFVDELMQSRRTAGLATLLVAVSPPVLQWHLSAGGIVRAPGAFLAITGLYTGLRLFRDGGRQWLAISAILFGLTILTHPVYAVFFGLSYLWLAASFARSTTGLGRGAIVAVGGVAFASPWWTVIVERFGFGVFTGAAGTHGGIGQALPSVVRLLSVNLIGFPEASLEHASRSGVLFNVQPHLFDLFSGGTILLIGWLLFIVGSTVHLSVRNDIRASRRALFLTGWLLLTMGLVSKLRFSFLIGAIVFAVIVFEYVVPALERPSFSMVDGRHLAPALILMIGLLGLIVGGLYAGSELNSHAGSTSQPQFIGDADLAAMSWVQANTQPSASFVVIGDAAEWFPYRTHREILVGPWGIEWHGKDAYQQQLRRYNTISTCRHEACITSMLLSSETRPDYLYVPTRKYTVRGMEVDPSRMLPDELSRSEAYDLVYRNEGVMVFEVDLDATVAPDAEADPVPGSPVGTSRGHALTA